MPSYFGFRKESVNGYEAYTSIALTSDKEDFLKIDDDIKGEEKSSGDHKRQEKVETFFSVSTSFFDAMLGFTDVMARANAAYHVLQTVELDKFKKEQISSIALSEEEIGEWTVSTIKSEAITRVSRQTKRLVRQLDHLSAIDQVFLMGLVSQFDAYVGRLIRVLATSKPHIIFESEKKYSAADVFDYGSIEAFREAVLEREVEGVLRDSHEKQFKWLEDKMKIKLREGLAVWPEFIEIFERRNLFAHTGGIVSKSYLEKCQEVGYKTDHSLGDLIGVTSSYLVKSALVLLEIGAKLAQVLARVANDTAECHTMADRNINDMAYELIHHAKYSCAISLLEFALSKPMKHPKKAYQHMLRINLANAYKLNGNKNKAKEVLDVEDWRATQIDFQICAAAVLDDLDDIRSLINKVPVDLIAPADYFVWPVFSGLLKDPLYVELIRETFGEQIVSIYWRSGVDEQSPTSENLDTAIQEQA